MTLRMPKAMASNLPKYQRVAKALSLSVLIWATFPRYAHAYLDAGTGSMLIQALVASAAAALILAKTYWSRLKKFFGGKSPEAGGDIERNGDS